MIDNYNQNPNQLQYTAINPNAMSNMQSIQSVGGMPNPSIIGQIPNQIAQPSINQTPTVLPPQGVGTAVTPPNNLQNY
jgi:hypothetical protein